MDPTMARMPPGEYIPQEPTMVQGLAPMAKPQGAPLEGSEKTAIAFVETAAEMLEAAADESPTLAPAIEEIKAFIGQTLAKYMPSGVGQGMPGMLAGGIPQQIPSGPAYPPTGF